MPATEPQNPQELESIMVGWAEEAAAIARSHFLKTGELQFKYAREAVTEADREIERHLAAQIAARFPDDRVFGEEFGPGGPDGSGATDGSAATDGSVATDGSAATDGSVATDDSATTDGSAEIDGGVSEQLTVPAGRVWHIDPIDGTLNFALGLPNFCTSIALMDGEEILAACVYAPLHREAFTATRGTGCRLNGETIHVSDRGEFAEAIVSAQLQKGGRYVRNAQLLQAILLRSLKMRRLGTIALEMAYLAAGRYDAMIAGRGRPVQLYDVAAGILLVREAGGRISNHLGDPYRPFVTDLIASNGLVHDELIGIIAEYDGDTVVD